MKVKFKVNLGRVDAELLGLDYKKCLIGTEHDVSDGAASRLFSMGHAEVVEQRVRGEAKKADLTAPSK